MSSTMIESADDTQQPEFKFDQEEFRIPLKKIEINSLTLIKIANHCATELPNLARGQLLGIDVKSLLEITHSFPFPTSSSGATPKDGAAYQVEMIKCLKDANIDHQSVGWYQAAYLGSFVTESLIETQFKYQQNRKKAVVLVFDPVRSSVSSPWVIALRLSDKFMKLYREKKLTLKNLADYELSVDGIFEEIPIEIVDSCLSTALLSSSSSQLESSAGLVIPNSASLEKTLDLMTESFDQFSQDQYRFNKFVQYYNRHQQSLQYHLQRRRQENQRREEQGQDPLPEEDIYAQFKQVHQPSRLDHLIFMKQLDEYCEVLADQVESSAAKLKVTEKILSSVE